MRTFLLATLSLLILATGAAPQATPLQPDDASPLTDADRALLAWWDSLDLPDLSTAAFMRVHVPWGPNGWERSTMMMTGFAVSSEGARVRLFTWWFEEQDFPQTEYTHERAGSIPPPETLDFVSIAQDLVDAAQDQDRASRLAAILDWDTFGPMFRDMYVNCSFLAWVLHSRGQEALAQTLFVLAREDFILRRRSSDVLAHIQDRLPAMCAEHCLDRMTRPDTARTSLRDRYLWLAETFPECADHDWIVRAAETLTQMIAEDEAHAEADLPPFEEMTQEQQIAELIYQLRDQPGRQDTIPGHPSVLSMQVPEDSPAHQLIAHGLDAVPALIAILDDERFTRVAVPLYSKSIHRAVVRYGDAAIEIIQRIAGQRFYTPNNSGMTMLRQGVVEEVRARVIEWYESTQEE